MENNKIFEMIDAYKDLLDRKDALAEETKENNAAIEDAKKQLVDLMVENECPQIARNGFSYTLQTKSIYNKRGDDKLMAEGVNFLDTLRAEGLGDLIQETVNSRTLSSAVNNYVEEHGELSEGLAKIVSLYETYDISKRKAKTV